MASENILQVIDLCKSFHKLEVLKNISVSFNKNEVVSIIGPSGGGKSAFLSQLGDDPFGHKIARELEACGIDSKVYSGYALGMGIERITNLKYQVKDLRMFSENDVRFLHEFEAAN